MHHHEYLVVTHVYVLKKNTLIWANAPGPTLEVFKGQAWVHIAANEPYLCTVPNKSHLSLNNPEL